MDFNLFIKFALLKYKEYNISLIDFSYMEGVCHIALKEVKEDHIVIHSECNLGLPFTEADVFRELDFNLLLENPVK